MSDKTAEENEFSKGKRIIELNSPDGNAFVLLGCAKEFSSFLEISWEDIYEEMTAKDYEHLVKVFEKYFNEFVFLKR